MVQWIKKADEFPQSEQIKEFWRPQESGDEFVGVLEKVIPNKGAEKNNNLYLFRNENGELIGIMGTKQLNEVLPDLVGKKVVIVYRGKVKKKKGIGYVNLYDIGIDESYEPEEYISELDLSN